MLALAILAVDLAWDSVVFVIGLATLVYLLRVKRLFAGGAVNRALNYFILAMAIACFAFGVRIILDLVGFDPVSLLISVRDLGTAVIMVVILLGLRAGEKLWPRTD